MQAQVLFNAFPLRPETSQLQLLFFIEALELLPVKCLRLVIILTSRSHLHIPILSQLTAALGSTVLSFCSRSFFFWHVSTSFHHSQKKISFSLSSNKQISYAPFFNLHHATKSCVVFASSSQLALSCPDGLSMLLLLVLPFQFVLLWP